MSKERNSYLIDEARGYRKLDAWLKVIGYDLPKKITDARNSGFEGIAEVWRVAHTFKKRVEHGK